MRIGQQLPEWKRRRSRRRRGQWHRPTTRWNSLNGWKRCKGTSSPKVEREKIYCAIHDYFVEAVTAGA
jgi:hypothetical protein